MTSTTADSRPSTTSVADSAETCGTASLSDIKRLVLMPVDGSEHSDRAFNWYLNNLQRSGDGLHLAHIVEPLSPGMNYGIASKTPALKEDFTKQLNKLVEGGRVLRTKYISRCEELNLPARFTIHIGTKPGEHIVRLTQDQDVGMVIIGNRGIGTVRRTFLGSVSDYIIHNANIPVIIIPPIKSSKKK